MSSGSAVGHAHHRIPGHADIDFFRSAFHVVVKITVAHLAGANTGADTGLLDMTGIAEQGIAMGRFPITDGNGPGMALTLGVVGTLRNFALGHEGHINGHFHNGLLGNRVG
jgi:hypothetical protein